MDVFTLRTDIFLFIFNQSTMDGCNHLWVSCFTLTLEKGLLPVFHLLFETSDVVLHFLYKSINFCYNLHGLVDEGVDSIRVPLECINTSLESFVHLINTIGEQWLLNNQELGKHGIVHIDNKLKLASLMTEDINS
jgi:hypothetical protein